MAATTRRIPVYGGDGRIVASVDPARNRWLGEFLAECELGHVYITEPEALRRNEVNGCPVCDTGDEMAAE